nr:MAG TPA: hypothetical protein [Caudoviricetes sp.]
MERLIDNIYSFKDKVEECENAYLLLAVQKKLKEYEDLEEQGRLIKLSCKVGDTVYYINPDKNTINELVVYGFDIRPLQRFVYDYMGARLNFNQFGKTVFLTKSEAEAKLKELRGGENE